MGCFVLFVYTWIMPNISKLFQFTNKKIQQTFSGLVLRFKYVGDKKIFTLYAYTSLYLIVFILFSIFVNKLPIDFNILKVTFIVLTIIPVVISTFVGSVFILSIVLGPIITRNYPHEASHELISYLIDAIYLSDLFNENTTISVSDKDKLISLIKNASRNLHELESHFKSKLAKDQIDYSIKSLKSYLTWVYAPEKSTFETLSKELCVYLKAAITGNYHYFPTVSETENNYPVNNKKSRIFFGVYLSIPIIGALLVRNYFGYTIDNDIRNMFYVLYGIWVFIGLSIFSFKINDDTVVLFKELIRYILKIKKV